MDSKDVFTEEVRKALSVRAINQLIADVEAGRHGNQVRDELARHRQRRAVGITLLLFLVIEHSQLRAVAGCHLHNGHRHEAMDIIETRRTPAHAVVTGTIRKLFLSKPGGITIYEFDEKGEYCYYYAHLDRYAAGLHEGMSVQSGNVIGFVGWTGNAVESTPHLHFAIFELGPEKQWSRGKAVNPYPGLVEAVKRSK